MDLESRSSGSPVFSASLGSPAVVLEVQQRYKKPSFQLVKGGRSALAALDVGRVPTKNKVIVG